MATHRIPIITQNMLPESGVFPDRVGNQITATNQVGNQLCLVMADGGSDEGFYDSFKVPKNYVGTGKIVATGILDGAMSSVTFQIGVRGLTVADNEASDTAYSTEDTGNTTTDHADKDKIEVSITLSNLSGLAVDDEVHYYFFIDATGTYTGNFLLTQLEFEYADA